MRDGSGQYRIMQDESYETAKSTSNGKQFKIEYQPAQKHTLTRKQSKVSTLVNSLMSTGNNTTTNIIQKASGMVGAQGG